MRVARSIRGRRRSAWRGRGTHRRRGAAPEEYAAILDRPAESDGQGPPPCDAFHRRAPSSREEAGRSQAGRTPRRNGWCRLRRRRCRRGCQKSAAGSRNPSVILRRYVTLPQRVFYHIPLVPAGQEVKTQFGASPLGESPATFSLWCDEGEGTSRNSTASTNETQVEEIKEEFLANREAAEARRKPLFGNSSQSADDRKRRDREDSAHAAWRRPSTPGEKPGRSQRPSGPIRVDHTKKLRLRPGAPGLVENRRASREQA